MAREEEVYDVMDKAIIESFLVLKAEALPRRRIIEKAHELCKKSEANIAKRIEKRLKEPKNYLIKVDYGIYKLNPDLEFIFEGEPLAPEIELTEIPSERREAHTSNLKSAIRHWIENFPKVPGSANSSFFFHEVEDCERHSLYSDLINHLPQSGFGVFSRWEQYKRSVLELDKTKKDLLIAIEKAISDIFPDLQLKFVGFHDLMRLYVDYYPPMLEDFECSLPSLMYNHLLFELDIDDERLRYAKTREEEEEIQGDIMRNYAIWRDMEDRIRKLPITEKDDSVIWGQDGNMELIRVPNSQSGLLVQGREKATTFFLEKSDAVNKIVTYIIRKYNISEKERRDLIEELNKSLYCECFSGDCRYLGD